MSDTIGPDGLTDEEREDHARARCVSLSEGAACDRLESTLEAFAAERLAHAETRARAEKAEAERDRLRAALEEMTCATEAALRWFGDGGGDPLEPADIVRRDMRAAVKKARGEP